MPIKGGQPEADVYPLHSSLNPADTPLLLIAWRRPHTLCQVIDAIRPVGPTRLFVACDGPNPERPGETEKVAATRQVIEQEIDWPCQIERLYSEVNQGCRLGVSRAITWFFEQVEEGIILEDDCVPHPDFFPYCATLLERYRHDTRVWCISGDNATNVTLSSCESSYGFIRYPLVWGWATWRRCWSQYRSNLEGLDEVSNSTSFVKELFGGNSRLASWRLPYWKSIRDKKHPDSWAAVWAYTCMVNSGITILPRVNLVSNVGFGIEGTHTLKSGSQRDSASCFPIVPVVHPTQIIRDVSAEEFLAETVYGIKSKARGFLPDCMHLIAKVKSRLLR